MAENMTEEQLADYKLAFAHFDKDNDGMISIEELKLIVEELGHSAADTDWQGMMNEMDADNDGNVDFAEFLAMMARRLMLSDNEEEILEAFKVFDKDNNGELSAQELKAVLTTLGEKLTPEECDEILELADKDHDGVINYREFVRLLLTK
jgi:calmodulin